MSLTQGVKESIWLQAILRDLGATRHIEEMQNINLANQGAIALAQNAEFHARTKHFDIHYYFLREHVANQTIVLHYCPTTDMTADVFTKPLPQPAFIKHSIGLGLINHSAFLLQYSAHINDNKLGLPTSNDQQDADWDGSTGERWYCESPALTLDFSPHTTPTPESQRC